MSRLHVAFFAGVAVIGGAGTAGATEHWRTTSVALPDGSVAEIQYLGDVPPRVTIVPPAAEVADHEGYEQEDADVALLPATRAAEPYPATPRFVVAGDVPSGSTYEYTLITTGTDGRVCTQRTEWRSRGPDKEPEMRRTDTGEGCGEAHGGPAPVPVPAPAIPRPRIVPVDPDAI